MNVNPKPRPPLPGGEYTHTGDPGTPPLPPGVKVVNLIPVGDGGPGPLLTPAVRRRKESRKPLLPGAAELDRLPRGARVALTERCVQRSLPALRRADPLLTDLAVTAEQAAVLPSDDPRVAAETVARAAEAILRVASDPDDLRLIRRDYARFAWLAKHHGWTDDTPVAPDAVGPLWPPGRVPHWARERKKPRE